MFLEREDGRERDGERDPSKLRDREFPLLTKYELHPIFPSLPQAVLYCKQAEAPELCNLEQLILESLEEELDDNEERPVMHRICNVFFVSFSLSMFHFSNLGSSTLFTNTLRRCGVYTLQSTKQCFWTLDSVLEDAMEEKVSTHILVCDLPQAYHGRLKKQIRRALPTTGPFKGEMPEPLRWLEMCALEDRYCEDDSKCNLWFVGTEDGSLLIAVPATKRYVDLMRHTHTVPEDQPSPKEYLHGWHDFVQASSMLWSHIPIPLAFLNHANLPIQFLKTEEVVKEFVLFA